LKGSPKLFIHSAASSLGLFVIEIAKHIRSEDGHPLRIFATASPKNHERLKALGVEAAFDYRAPDWPEQVVKASGGGITHAVDCYTGEDSVAKTSQTFVPEGGVVAVIRGGTYPEEGIRANVKPVLSGAWLGLGHQITFRGQQSSYDLPQASPLPFFKK
jgi:NADPH:quinone reductase-like Zn-dependent oxidoreductase